MSPPRNRRSSIDPVTLRRRGRHQRAARRRRRRSGAVAALAGVALIAVIAGVAGTDGVLAYGSSCDLDALQPTRIGQNTFVYAADGSLLGSIPAEKNREPVSAGDMSRWTRRATIAIEDRRFFEHRGVDVEGIARATVKNLEAGGIVEGRAIILMLLPDLSSISSSHFLGFGHSGQSVGGEFSGARRDSRLWISTASSNLLPPGLS